MHRLILIALLALPSALLAQSPSGRHFHRPSRQPATPAASPASTAATEASTNAAARVEPLRKLRSGRAWSAFHFSRRPITPGEGAVKPVDAASKAPVRRTVMWGRVVRG